MTADILEFKKLRFKAHLMGLGLLEAISQELPYNLERDYNEGLKKLSQGYPLDYLVGFVDIGSVRIHTPEGVFIPRPETISWIPRLKHFITRKNIDTIVDYCAGSGLISCMLSPHFSQVYAIEKDPLAFENLRLSVASNTSYNVNCIKSDTLLAVPSINKSWALISNPPYVPNTDVQDSVIFEPHTAIYSGEDGLELFNEMVDVLVSMRNKPDAVCVELDPRNIDTALVMLNDIGYKGDIITDESGHKRFIHSELVTH